MCMRLSLLLGNVPSYFFYYLKGREVQPVSLTTSRMQCALANIIIILTIYWLLLWIIILCFEIVLGTVPVQL